MNFSREGERVLSLRLLRLRSFYQSENHVWDIGCDHGLLGLSFTENPTVQEIHFVDPSLPVIEKLKTKPLDSYITKPLIFHHKKGQEITISSPSNAIFIAGMGGKEIIEILSSLLPQIDHSSRFILSPHRKILELRMALRKLPVHLQQEEVVHEDGQFYQMIILGVGHGGKEVSRFGDELWTTETGALYREHQLKAFKVHRDETSLDYIEYLKALKVPKRTHF